MAAGPTFEPLATTTLSSAASSITFSSISSAYTDLRLVYTGTLPADILIQFNNDTGTNYSTTDLYGNGTTATSGRTTSQTFISVTTNATASSTIPVLMVSDIFSYAGSTYKTMLNSLSNDLNGSGKVISEVGLWRSTSAINAIKISGSTFATGTTATLYGIKSA